MKKLLTTLIDLPLILPIYYARNCIMGATPITCIDTTKVGIHRLLQGILLLLNLILGQLFWGCFFGGVAVEHQSVWFSMPRYGQSKRRNIRNYLIYNQT